MERLGLERKLKESERKVQMLASSRESILSQTAQLGQKCSAVKRQVDEATLQLESVEKSGKGNSEPFDSLCATSQCALCTVASTSGLK